MLAGGLGGGCDPVLAALAGTDAGDEAAPQPASSATATTAAANGARQESFMLVGVRSPRAEAATQHHAC